jgi:hypothetical protein
MVLILAVLMPTVQVEVSVFDSMLEMGSKEPLSLLIMIPY